jgi:heptose-I-phosphate ethanolaminephosphotransferase
MIAPGELQDEVKKTDKHVSASSAGVLSRLAAGAITLPFLLALPGYIDPERLWWNLGLGASLAGVFLVAQFMAEQVARRAGGGLVGAFAAVILTLGLLGFASTQDYGFEHAFTDLGLVYLIFFVAAAASWIAPLLGRVVLALLLIPLSAAALVQAVHMQTFGFAIGRAGYRAILQSSGPEALEFANHFLGAGSLAAAAAVLALVTTAVLFVRPGRPSGRALGLGSACAAIVFPILGEHGWIVASRLQGFGEATEYAQEIVEYRDLLESRGARPLDARIAQEAPFAGQPQTYVFVIGESLTRNHMSLYGYWRETTPRLAALAPEMAVFTDVVSPHSHTEPSLELVLTLATQSNGLRFTDASNYSLIEILRAAGFTTWWLSNQNSFGPWDNKTAVLARAADRVHYTSTRSGAFITGPLDEALLEPFAAALADPAPRKAIFLHVLGSHFEYAKRYPPEAAVFRELPAAREIGARFMPLRRSRQVNEYDNAVRYFDRLSGEIIEKVRATGQAAAVTIFADHGENLYEFKGHYWQQFTNDHVEVPLMLWFSSEYGRLAGSAALEQARAGAALPFALEDLPHLVADLMRLQDMRLERVRSPLSVAYRPPTARPLFERSVVYEEADEPLLNVRRALRHIARAEPGLRGAVWAHRVNTLGKMMEVAGEFAGAEIDVVYEAGTGTLLVNHPPTPPSGLTLDELLAYANRLNPRLALWLDVKNLDEANAPHVVEALDRLDARHAIRSRALVETGHTGPAAAKLRQARFLSSYYLPTAVVTRHEPAVSASPCQGAAEIERAVERGRFAAVSYDWRGRRWVERCLGRFVRSRALRTYTWDLGVVLSDALAQEGLDGARLREYAQLSAVLLPYRSSFDDWR